MSVLFIENNLPVEPAPVVSATEETQAVQAVDAPSPVRAVVENRLRRDRDISPVDVMEISAGGRDLSRSSFQNRLRNARTGTGLERREAGANEVLASVNNRGVRELVAGMAGYDNSEAVRAFNRYLSVSARYGGAGGRTTESGAAGVRAEINRALSGLGVSRVVYATRETREGISRAIDRWFVGEGVFMPQMLDYSSSDGFRFTPLTEEANQARRAADVLGSYERRLIVTYLREMAVLQPADFMFYDPTGLGALSLADRRSFLARMEELLQRAQADARAAELRYWFRADGTLDLERMGLLHLQDEIDRQTSQNRESYYGQLLNSVRQYGLSVLSQAMA